MPGVDETGDLTKGPSTVGVQRQYSGTEGRIEMPEWQYIWHLLPRAGTH